MTKIILGKYQHYKGNRYEVVDVAKHSETLEKMVIYKALYGEGEMWIRPLKMFTEKVKIGNKLVSRFKYLGKNV